MHPVKMTRIVGGLRYDTSKAILLAHDRYWDGHNLERHGRNTFLYKTPKGRYFVVRLTMWQGERDTLEPVTPDEARRLYEEFLPVHEVSYEEAFPNVQVEEA